MGANGRRHLVEPAAYFRSAQSLLAGCGLAVAENRTAGQLGIAGRWAAVLVSGAAGRISAVPEAGVIGSGRRAGADGGVGLGMAAGRRSSGVAGAGCQQMAAVAGDAADGAVSDLATANPGGRLGKSGLGYCAACRPDAAAARRR